MYMCDPPRIYPSLPEYTPLPTTVGLCDPPRIYPSLPEYTLIFNNYFIMRRSQNLSLPFRMYPPPPFNNCIRHSQKLPFPQRIHPRFLTKVNYMPPPLPLRIYSSSPFYNIPRIYPSFTEYAPFSKKTTCNCERMYHLLPELKFILGVRGRFWEGRKIL